MKKNILIYSHVALWEVHHAETVEIALKSLKEKHNVFVLSCMGDLTACPANSFHDDAKCGLCRKQTNYTLNKVLKNRTQNIAISLSEHPDHAPIPEEISFESLKKLSYEEMPVGELILSQLADDISDSYIDFSDQKVVSRAKNLLKNAVSLYEYTKTVIADKEINVVYAWNGRRCSDGPVLYAAKKMEKEFYSYISGGRRNTYMTMRAVKVHDLALNKELVESTYLKACETYGDEAVAKKAQEMFNIARYGGGDFAGEVFFGKNFKQSYDAVPVEGKKKNLTIFTSSFWEYFAMGDWLNGEYPYDNFYDGLVEILSENCIHEKYNITVRWHPNLVNAGSAEKKVVSDVIKQFESVRQYAPEDNVNSYLLLENSDVVLTFGSTIGIEAVYYGRPSVLLGPAMYEDTNTCYRPKTHLELIKLLQNDLVPGDRLGALKYGYYIRHGAAHQFTELRRINDNHFMFNFRPLNVDVWRVFCRWMLSKVPGVQTALRKLKGI